MATDITDVHGRLTAITASPVNAQTGTSYTLTLDDAGSIVTMTNAAASTLTIPPDSTVKFPIGAAVTVAQLGAGQVTVAAGAGVTLLAAPTAKVLGANSVVRVQKIATDTWILSGAIAAT